MKISGVILVVVSAALVFSSLVYAQGELTILDLPEPDEGYRWELRRCEYGYIAVQEPLPLTWWQRNNDWIRWVVPSVLVPIVLTLIGARKKGYTVSVNKNSKGVS